MDSHEAAHFMILSQSRNSPMSSSNALLVWKPQLYPYNQIYSRDLYRFHTPLFSTPHLCVKPDILPHIIVQLREGGDCSCSNWAGESLSFSIRAALDTPLLDIVPSQTFNTSKLQNHHSQLQFPYLVCWLYKKSIWTLIGAREWNWKRLNTKWGMVRQALPLTTN